MNWVRVATIDELPDDRGIRVEIGRERVALFRVGDAVYAIGDRCSHAEASLSEGDLFDNEVECPRHGSIFDVTSGKPESLPATKPVPVYDVRLEDGEVYLGVEG